MASNISFTTTFDRSTNTITFVDTTNYATLGAGFPLGFFNQMKGYIKVTYNTGAGNVLVYNNIPSPLPVPPAPWPTPNSSNTGAVVNFAPSTINIPLTNTGQPIPAQYTITYTVAVFSLLPLTTTVFTATNTYNYNFTDPSICIKTAVNCSESAIQSSDDTVYDVPNGNIVSIVRAHTLYPPPATGQIPLGPLNQATLIQTPIFTTTWTAELISTVTYLMNDGLTIIVVLNGIKEFQVVCDTNLSKIICCLVNLQKEYEALLCKNPVKAEMFFDNKLNPSLQHLILFLAAQSAGDQSKMDCEYTALIKSSGCGGDCGCQDSTPVIVQPIGVGFSYTLQSSGGTIVVTQTIVGNTINWDIDIDPAILAAINNISATAVSTATPQFITVTQVGAAPNFNYQVDFDANEVDKLIIIDPNLNATLDYLEFTDTDIVNSGSKINAVGSQTVILGVDITGNPISPNSSANYAVFVFSGLLITGTDPFTATANVMSSNSPIQVASVTNLAAEVFHVDPVLGDVYVRLYNPQNGQLYTLQDIKTGTWDKVYIKFNFKA